MSHRKHAGDLESRMQAIRDKRELNTSKQRFQPPSLPEVVRQKPNVPSKKPSAAPANQSVAQLLNARPTASPPPPPALKPKQSSSAALDVNSLMNDYLGSHSDEHSVAIHDTTDGPVIEELRKKFESGGFASSTRSSNAGSVSSSASTVKVYEVNVAGVFFEIYRGSIVVSIAGVHTCGFDIVDATGRTNSVSVKDCGATLADGWTPISELFNPINVAGGGKLPLLEADDFFTHMLDQCNIRVVQTPPPITQPPVTQEISFSEPQDLTSLVRMFEKFFTSMKPIFGVPISYDVATRHVTMAQPQPYPPASEFSPNAFCREDYDSPCVSMVSWDGNLYYTDAQYYAVVENPQSYGTLTDIPICMLLTLHKFGATGTASMNVQYSLQRLDMPVTQIGCHGFLFWVRCGTLEWCDSRLAAFRSKYIQ